MDTTTNYGLKKPADTDGADINVIDTDMDMIDAQMKTNHDLAAAAVPVTQKGTASGVATLDSGGKVPKDQLPATGGYVRQDTAPADTSLLWVDSASGNVMKFYNGSAWAPVPATWG